MSSNKPVIGFEDNLEHNYQEYAPTMYALGKMRAARTPYDIDDTVILDANKLFRPGLFLMTQGTTNVVPSYTLTANDICYLYNLLPDPDNSLKGGHTSNVDIHSVPMHVRQIAYLYKNGETIIQTRVGVKSAAVPASSLASIEHLSDIAGLSTVSDWTYRFVYEIGYWIRYKTVGGINTWEPALDWSAWSAFGGGSSEAPTHDPVSFLPGPATASPNTIYVSFGNNTLTLPNATDCELGDTVRLDQWQTNGSVANFNGATIETMPNQIQIGSTDFTWEDPFNMLPANTIFRDNSDGSWTGTVGATVYTIRKNSAERYVLTNDSGELLSTKDLTNAAYPWSENTSGQNNWSHGISPTIGNVTMVRGVANGGCNSYEFEVTYDGYHADNQTKIWIQKNNGGTTTVATYDFSDHNGVQLGYNGDKLTVSGTSAGPSVPGTVMTTHTLSRMATNAAGYNNTVPSVTAVYNAVSSVSTTVDLVSGILANHINNHPGGGGAATTLEGTGVIDAIPIGENNYEISLNWTTTKTNGINLDTADGMLIAKGNPADIGIPGVVKTTNTLNAVDTAVNPYTVPTVNAVSNAVNLISTYVQEVSAAIGSVSSVAVAASEAVNLVSATMTEVSEALRVTSADYAATSSVFTEVSGVVADLVAGGGGGGGTGIQLGAPLYYSGVYATLSATYAEKHSGVALVKHGDTELRAIGVPATGTFTAAADTFGVVKTISSIPTAPFSDTDTYTNLNGEVTAVTNPGEKYVVPTVVAVQDYVAAMSYNGPFNVKLVNANTVSVGGCPLDNDNNVAGRMYYKADASCTMLTSALEYTGAGLHEVYAYLYYNGTGYTSGYAVDTANIPTAAKGEQGTYRLLAKFNGTTVCQTQYGDIVFPARW